MNKRNRNDGYVALRDATENQRIRYSELFQMLKHKIMITKDDKQSIKTNIAKGRQIRELTSNPHYSAP